MDDNDLPFDYGLRLLADAIDHPSLQSPKQTNSVDHFAGAAMDDDQQPRGDGTGTPRRIRKLGCEAKLESAVSIILEGNNKNSYNAKKKPRENSVVKRQQPNKVDLKLCPKSPPGNISALIEDMRGTDVKLVIRKEIQQTDLQTHHNRMSIPPSKIVTRDFLSKGEENIIQNKGNIKVFLIDPCLHLTDDLSLRKWQTTKSFIYVLCNWNWVVKKNKFEQGRLYSYGLLEWLEICGLHW